MIELRQSTARTVKIGQFVSIADATPKTDLTINQADVRLSKANGADIAQKHEATACTHDELGVYGCPLDTTDTDTLGEMVLYVNATGAMVYKQYFSVITANEWDSKYSNDVKQVHVIEMNAAIANQIRDTMLSDATPFAGANIATILTNLLSILADTSEMQGDLVNGGRLDLLIDAIKAKTDLLAFTGGNVNAHTKAEDNLAFGAQKKADINTEIVDCLNVDTYEEPPREKPPATTSLVKKIGYLFKLARNKITNDGVELKVYNDDAVTVDHKAAVSESGGTVTRAEYEIGS